MSRDDDGVGGKLLVSAFFNFLGDNTMTDTKVQKAAKTLTDALATHQIFTEEQSNVSTNAAKDVIEQSMLKDNILAYKTANSYYLDALSLAKIMGVLDIAKDNIAPFPQRPAINTVIAPQIKEPQPKPKIDTWLQKLSKFLPVLGAGAAIPLAVYAYSMWNKPPVVDTTPPPAVAEPIDPSLEVEVL